MSRDKITDVIELQPHELLQGLAQVIRETQKEVGYYEMQTIAKGHLNNVLAETAKREKKVLTEREIQALAGKLYTEIMIKSVKQGLAILSKYYAGALTMNKSDFLAEKHNSRRLGRHLRYVGQKCSINTAAHAIVSGAHEAAAAARKILAKWKIRIDDPDNGVFLPRDSRYMPHPELKDAVNHAELHTEEYYINITAMLRQATSEQECRETLRLIAQCLIDGTLEY